MRLISIKYSQFEGRPAEWILDEFNMGTLNLLAGKNASGKSRIISLIKGLSSLVSGEIKMQFVSAKYEAKFELEDGKILFYYLEAENQSVIKELLSVDGVVKLDRKTGGVGRIYAEKQDIFLEFQTPVTELACVARRDSIQHSFFEPLFQWGNSLLYYQFGTLLGKDRLAMVSTTMNEIFNPRDTNLTIQIFEDGINKFKENFKHKIIENMSRIDYEILDIGVSAPLSLHLPGQLPPVKYLYVKEKSLPCITEQSEMSQGMFRVLSLIIQLNYSVLALKPNCVLIDDIGEGLDFDRSCKIIELLTEKTHESSLQMIMSSNDEFVMNKIPLESWSLVRRDGGKVKIIDKLNSTELFEKFKFTGLSNFDFLAMDFPSHSEDVEL